MRRYHLVRRPRKINLFAEKSRLSRTRRRPKRISLTPRFSGVGQRQERTSTVSTVFSKCSSRISFSNCLLKRLCRWHKSLKQQRRQKKSNKHCPELPRRIRRRHQIDPNNSSQ